MNYRSKSELKYNATLYVFRYEGVCVGVCVFVWVCVCACINKSNMDGQIREIGLRLGNWESSGSTRKLRVVFGFWALPSARVDLSQFFGYYDQMKCTPYEV